MFICAFSAKPSLDDYIKLLRKRSGRILSCVFDHRVLASLSIVQASIAMRAHIHTQHHVRNDLPQCGRSQCTRSKMLTRRVGYRSCSGKEPQSIFEF